MIRLFYKVFFGYLLKWWEGGGKKLCLPCLPIKQRRGPKSPLLSTKITPAAVGPCQYEPQEVKPTLFPPVPPGPELLPSTLIQTTRNLILKVLAVAEDTHIARLS